MLTAFAKSTRKHRIGRARVLFVIENNPRIMRVNSIGETIIWWLGEDDRGVELEIGAIHKPDLRSGEMIMLIIHVMPTALRRK